MSGVLNIGVEVIIRFTVSGAPPTVRKGRQLPHTYVTYVLRQVPYITYLQLSSIHTPTYYSNNAFRPYFVSFNLLNA